MVVRRLDLIPLPQADQPKGQQAAQLCAPFSGAHLVWRQRVRTFHVVMAVFDEVLPIKSHLVAHDGTHQRNWSHKYKQGENNRLVDHGFVHDHDRLNQSTAVVH